MWQWIAYLAAAGISLEQLFCHNPLSSRWSGPGLPGGWGLWLSQPLIFWTGCYDLPVMSFLIDQMCEQSELNLSLK